MLSVLMGGHFICNPIIIKIEFNIKNIALSVSPVAIATMDNTSDANIIPIPNDCIYFFIVVFSFLVNLISVDYLTMRFSCSAE